MTNATLIAELQTVRGIVTAIRELKYADNKAEDYFKSAYPHKQLQLKLQVMSEYADECAALAMLIKADADAMEPVDVGYDEHSPAIDPDKAFEELCANTRAV